MSFGLVESKRLKTKKALKDAVAAGERPLVFDTSLHGGRGTISIDLLRSSDVIVGPNVLNDRKWYANFKNGKVV
jgi:hypothetical protein